MKKRSNQSCTEEMQIYRWQLFYLKSCSAYKFYYKINDFEIYI